MRVPAASLTLHNGERATFAAARRVYDLGDSFKCPLFGVDRKWLALGQSDAFDPKRSMSGLPRAIVGLADRSVPTIGPMARLDEPGPQLQCAP